MYVCHCSNLAKACLVRLLQICPIMPVLNTSLNSRTLQHLCIYQNTMEPNIFKVTFQFLLPYDFTIFFKQRNGLKDQMILLYFSYFCSCFLIYSLAKFVLPNSVVFYYSMFSCLAIITLPIPKRWVLQCKLKTRPLGSGNK